MLQPALLKTLPPLPPTAWLHGRCPGPHQQPLRVLLRPRLNAFPQRQVGRERRRQRQRLPRGWARGIAAVEPPLDVSPLIPAGTASRDLQSCCPVVETTAATTVALDAHMGSTGHPTSTPVAHCSCVQGSHVCPVASSTGSRSNLSEMGQKNTSGHPASAAAWSKSLPGAPVPRARSEQAMGGTRSDGVLFASLPDPLE